MPVLHSIPIDRILIPKNRQRKLFPPEKIVELAGSISRLGLMHPVVVRRHEDGKSFWLVAGECRIKAMHTVWNFGEQVRCGTAIFAENMIPCNDFGEIEDPLIVKEMELEENIRRLDITWQEQAEATQELMELRTAVAKKNGEAPPKVDEIAAEVRGDSPTSREQTRKELIVAKHLADPEVQKARSADDAFKILKRREQLQKNAELAAQVGVTFNSSMHTLLNGDAIELMADLPKESFDVILTDPPYGIDADQFGNSGGLAGAGNQGSHFYTDSWTHWNKLMQWLAPESFRVAKPQAHLYLFCDIDGFVQLKHYFQEAGWWVFRTPLIWHNPTANRAPWPEHGPHRKWQMCMYAVKGERPVNSLKPDLVTYASDENLNHQAQKPVALYQDLLGRSVRPGDAVLDCFGGTGPIIPAGHILKCKVTYIEKDPAHYGTAVKRLKELE